MASPRRLRIDASLGGIGRLAGTFLVAGVVSLPVLLAAEVLLCSKASAQSVSRIPATALPSSPNTTYGSNITYTPNISGNKASATIVQTAPTNIVSWKSFDIGSASSVNIVQPSSTAVLLNKVDGGAYLNKTVIDGMLSANGRVYMYNPNGIIFGKTATVNADTLIASSLKFDESRVIGGLALPGNTPVLGADPAFVGGVPGAVQVEGDSSNRAALTSSTGGLILLAAPNVVNNGVLNAPDGQVILAAGSKIYLATPQLSQTGTSLRGLLVEVSNDYPAGTLGVDSGTTASTAAGTTTGTTGASTAENGASGQITVGRGNATMIGYAVNQNGIVSATTSVNLNGSIYLYARDQATQAGANAAWTPQRSGNLVLGPNSVTQVMPDLNDTSTLPTSAKSTFNKSAVTLNGADIELQQNAAIIAPGGNVTITAQALPVNSDVVVKADPNSKVRVDFAPGSIVDVSGSTGTQLAMESNVIQVDLRGTELADNVVLRDSPLYATKVNIDIRKGTPIANVSGWLDLVQQGLGELNAAGGTVNVSAEGAIIQRAGSKINVDGGYVDYLSGYVNTTKLQLNDKLVDIGSAAANTLYTAAVNLPNGPDNYEAGYRQGSSAGTVKFSAPIIVQQGDLSGQVTVGPLQRDVAAANHPQGGQLQIGNVSGSSDDTKQYSFAGNLVIGGTGTETAVPPEAGASFDITNADQRLLASTLDLDTAKLANAGFNRITARAMGDISVVAPITLAPGGQLSLRADASSVAGGSISFDAPVTIPGGSLTASAVGTVQVADGVSFDLAGRWVNDSALVSPTVDVQGNPVLNGGKLSLVANQVDIGNNVKTDVAAGAWLDAKSKSTQGKAGSITFEADPVDITALPSDAALQIGSGLNLSGYGFGSGGQFKLVGRNVTVETVPSSSSATDLSLQPAFFQQGGFTSYDIGANVNFTVAANTVVKPQAQSWQFNPGFNMVPSGNMNAVAAPYLFDLSGPAQTRPTTSVSFQSLSTLTQSLISKNIFNVGALVVNDGAQLVMDPGANLTLLAGQQLTVDGLLNAPAGHILLGLTANEGATDPFSATRSIWFGPKAEVLATGSTQRLYTNGDGVSSGEVQDGGTIQVVNFNKNTGEMKAVDGYVVAESGALFDVSGVGARGLRFKSSGTLTPKQDVASSGGSIDIRASEGLLFDGTLQGAAGGAGASGGSLSVALEGAISNQDYERILTISQKAPSGGIVPTGLQPGQAIVVDKTKGKGDKQIDLGWFLTGSMVGPNARHDGEGWITTKSFAPGGFGRLTFKSQDVLAFGLGTSDLSLSATGSLILDAPTFRADSNSSLTNSQYISDPLSGGHTLTLAAPYIQLGSDDQLYQIPEASNTGNAQLIANATTIDLIGNSALQGFGAANLNAKADIRLVGLLNTDGNGIATNYSQGSLAMTGNLTLTDAQTYPTTLSEYTFMVAADPADVTSGMPMSKTPTGVLTFASNGNTPQQVLSAGGSLTAVAPHITQDGTLVAPFGSITLGNLDQTLLSGSPPVPAGNDVPPFVVTPSSSDLPVSENNPILFGSFTLNNLRFPSIYPTNFSKSIVTSDLVYSSRSVTSVAGSGMVPFGSVVNGSVPTASDWQVSLNDGTSVSLKLNPALGGSLQEGGLPAKSIVSHAELVTTEKASVQDLSGGGSLFAYEFTPGKGGSQDILASNNTYAINPNFKGNVAPIDGTYNNSSLLPGASVYLSGMPGLPAGTYTLLPAHYALLPGGFSVSVAPNTSDMQAASNITQTDGSMLMAGRLLDSGSTRSNGFIVSSGTVVRNKSEFSVFDATTYFTDKANAAGVAIPELPIDGGHIAFDASGILALAGPPMVLNGTIKLAATDGGRSGTIDISAPNIQVVSNSSQSTGNAVQLVAGDLNALGADSVLLGGLRDTSNGSEHLTVGANNVTLSNDAKNPLSGPEIVIAASDSIKLDSGASVQGIGTMARSPQDLSLDGGGALLRVSSGSQVSVDRATSTKTGTLFIASGASVAASGSANLDATGNVTLNGQLNLAPGSALSLAANGISLGSDISVPDPAKPKSTDLVLQLGTSALDMLSNNLSQLSFNSYASDINLYGTVNLGSSTLQKLSFKGTGFQAYGAKSDPTNRQASFQADTVSFVGTQTSADPTPSATASGMLAVQANTIEIGDKAFAIHGYADTTLTANSQAIAMGSGGQLVTDHNMTLAAGRITAASGADATFKAGESMTLTHAQVSPIQASSTPLGGQLNFVADSIVSDAQIVAPSGKVVLSAPSGIDVTGGLISVAGSAVEFGNSSNGTTKYAPGGTIALYGGSVAVDKDATLDLSSVGAAAGALSIAANNGGNASVQLNGTLKANATAGVDGVVPTQGQFSLDVDQSDGQFGTLNAMLNQAGFTESRQFRFRQGDVAMGASDNLTAHQVVIAADDGNISIGGSAVIDASGAKGGSIELYASQASASGNAGKVTLSDNALLDAHATAVPTSDAGSIGKGGRVVIGTAASANGDAASSVSGSGSINLVGGSIDVAGSSVARNGSVTLRAPRLGDGSDVAIASLNTDIRNSSSTVIEAYKVYTASTISEKADSTSTGNLDATNNGSMYQDAANFSADQANILQRLGVTGNSSVSLSPGIEVRNPNGALTVSVNEFDPNAANRGWNLNAWRFGGAPVTLTLRAAGDLNIIGSISDGFYNPTNNSKLAMPDWSLDSSASASYRLSGGADFAAANPLAVNAAGTGNVYFGFADRVPNANTIEQTNPDGTVVTIPVPWKSTDGTLSSSYVSSAAAAAPVTLTDEPVALVRTGAGRIDISAGKDVTLGMAKFFVNSSSDPTIDGTPVISDSTNPFTHNDYKVSVFGASVYTAGQAPKVNAGNTSAFTAPPAVDSATPATTVADAAAFTAPQNNLNTQYGGSGTSNAAFGVGGGGISIYAGHDVVGPNNLSSDWFYRNGDGQPAVVADPKDPTVVATAAVPGTKVMLPATVPQLINDWLFRQGRSYVDANGNVVFEQLGNGQTLNTAWWSRYDYFKQGIATFGGGDIRITATNNVTDLSASVATSAYMPGLMPTTLKEQGGGDLLVRAGGDIQGGIFYVQKGDATLRADGSVTAGHYVPTVSYLDSCAGCSTTPLNPVLALGDAQVNVTAGRSLAIETAFNPMLTVQSENNVVADNTFGAIDGVNAGNGWASSSDQSYRLKYAQFSNFSTYGVDSAINLNAVGGNLLLSNDAAKLALASPSNIPNYQGTTSFSNQYVLDGTPNKLENLYLLEPARFSAAALSGDLSSLNGFTLMPSSHGQLDLLAAGTVSLNNGSNSASSTPIRMLDNDPNAMSNIYAPRVFSQTDVNVLNGTLNGISAHQLGGLHSGDTQPVRIVALIGDIIGDNSNAFTVSLPKEAQIQAGRDIIDLGFSIQQNSAADVSTVVAGRDFIDTTLASSDYRSNPVKNVVTGPGRIDISAGRNVDLGNGWGVDTRGNLDNPYLPEGGAGINVVAGGAKADYASFFNQLIQYGSVYAVSTSPTTLTTSEQNDLLAYVRSLKPDPLGTLTPDEALKVFSGFSEPQQSPFLDSHPSAMLSLLVLVLERKPGFSSTASTVDIWAAFRTLSQADQTAFLNAHPAVAASLAASAAQLSTALGVQPDYTSFSPQDMTDLRVAVGNVVTATASAENLWAAFRLLSQIDQTAFLNAHPKVVASLAANTAPLSTTQITALAEANKPQLDASFFSSLVEVGKQSNLANFDSMIASLFPTAAKAPVGDISVFGSQFKTEQGGAIDLFAPTGSVYAGLTTGIPPGGRSASTEGIFTIRGGAIASLVKNDFLVNTGRVFSLGGGDITLVSQYANIDAGKGAKTASSAPPPQISIDANGSVTVDVSSSISGSGIATLMTHPGQLPSNVYAIAPRGIFDAGDAGVRSSGSVDIVAPTVLNAANITAAGSISGAPTSVAEPSLGSIAAPSNAGTKSDDVAKALSNPNSTGANGTLSVEVVGYGDAATPNDDAPDDATDDASNGDSRKKKKKI